MSGVSAVVAVWCWPALVLGAAWRLRPRSVLALPTTGEPYSSSHPLRRLGVAVAAPVGRWVRRRLGRPADATADVRLGTALLVAAAAASVSVPLALVVGIGAATGPRLRARRLARQRGEAVADELPEVVDLLVLAAGAGLTPLSALPVACAHCHGPVGRALATAAGRIELGEHPEVALGAVVASLGDEVAPLVTALGGSIRDGTPLVGALERAGDEARRQRRRRAEESARQVPVKLLFPLVLCTLPAFALLTVVPLLVGALGSLQA